MHRRVRGMTVLLKLPLLLLWSQQLALRPLAYCEPHATLCALDRSLDLLEGTPATLQSWSHS